MIKSLSMPASTIGENPLHFPVPTEIGLGTVTVLCGPNGSGKSFILRMLKALLEGKSASQFNEGHGWRVETVGGNRISSHRPHHHKSQMTGIGTLSKARGGKTPVAHDLDLKVQLVVFGLLLESLPLVGEFDLERWLGDAGYRTEIFSDLEPGQEERVYWLSSPVPDFARLFEDVFSCRLGLRYTKSSLELVLAWENGVTAPIANWSDGQKSFFTVICTVLALKPDVYIFDEVENFMHPELISRTIEYLKRHCRQTVLSSHHPHLIFGRAVDAVYYVEALPPRRPAYAERFVKYQKQPSAPRRITRLETDRSKLASAYRLFDVRDAALLATAAYVRDAVDLHLNEAVLSLFECEAIPSGTGIYRDRQTEEIAGLIASFAPEPRLILDWGAGLGRSLTELSKRVSVESNDAPAWILYEPDATTRSSLNSVVKAIPSVQVAGDRAELAGVTAGIVLLTNVLHALDPEQWCEAISDAWSAVQGSRRGVILMTEIYPLLAPERFAVPVSPDWLTDLFQKLGFKTAVRHFAIQGSTSYCLAASAPEEKVPSRERLLEIVVDAWKDLHRRYVRDYEGIGPVTALVDRQDLLNAAFGLARVSSCLAALDRRRVAGPDASS